MFLPKSEDVGAAHSPAMKIFRWAAMSVSDSPRTANDVVLQLAKLARELESVTNELNDADMAAVNAREDAKLAESRAFITATGAMDLRKHQAVIDSHAERLAAETAEAIVRGLQRSSRTLQTRIDIGRTMGATIRTEVGLSGSGIHGA